MKKNERLAYIKKLVNEKNFISIADLANIINVSEMTIRRYARELDQQHKLRLVYGGVTSINYNNSGRKIFLLPEERNRNLEVKQAIAKEAIKMISPNDTIYIDSGTTAEQVAIKIPTDKHYTIITSSVNALVNIISLEMSTIIVQGGVYSHQSGVLYSKNVLDSFKQYRVNIAFMSATGFELTHGITSSYHQDFQLKQAAMEYSLKRVLLLDSSKFGVLSSCYFSIISDFECIITDSGIPKEYEEHVKQNDVELIIV